MNWIKIVEGAEMPEQEQNVLVRELQYNGRHRTTIAFMAAGDNEWYSSSTGQQLDDVTHWQPLPTPPKD